VSAVLAGLALRGSRGSDHGGGGSWMDSLLGTPALASLPWVGGAIGLAVLS